MIYHPLKKLYTNMYVEETFGFYQIFLKLNTGDVVSIGCKPEELEEVYNGLIDITKRVEVIQNATGHRIKNNAGLDDDQVLISGKSYTTLRNLKLNHEDS